MCTCMHAHSMLMLNECLVGRVLETITTWRVFLAIALPSCIRIISISLWCANRDEQIEEIRNATAVLIIFQSNSVHNASPTKVARMMFSKQCVDSKVPRVLKLWPTFRSRCSTFHWMQEPWLMTQKLCSSDPGRLRNIAVGRTCAVQRPHKTWNCCSVHHEVVNALRLKIDQPNLVQISSR
jgi:hypothetical protein